MTLNNLNVFFHVYGNSCYTFISHFKPVMYKDFEKKKTMIKIYLSIMYNEPTEENRRPFYKNSLFYLFSH